MPAYVKSVACDGCREHTAPMCVHLCPSDILRVDSSTGKAHNIEPDLCWECYSCVKVCPTQAIDVRSHADATPMGGQLIPTCGADTIAWTVNFRGGATKRFTFPTRTTPPGSIRPHEHLSPPTATELRQPGLCGASRYLPEGHADARSPA